MVNEMRIATQKYETNYSRNQKLAHFQIFKKKKKAFYGF